MFWFLHEPKKCAENKQKCKLDVVLTRLSYQVNRCETQASANDRLNRIQTGAYFDLPFFNFRQFECKRYLKYIIINRINYNHKTTTTTYKHKVETQNISISNSSMKQATTTKKKQPPK